MASDVSLLPQAFRGHLHKYDHLAISNQILALVSDITIHSIFCIKADTAIPSVFKKSPFGTSIHPTLNYMRPFFWFSSVCTNGLLRGGYYEKIPSGSNRLGFGTDNRACDHACAHSSRSGFVVEYMGKKHIVTNAYVREEASAGHDFCGSLRY